MSMKLPAGRGSAILPLLALFVLALGCGLTASAPQASSSKSVDTVPVDTAVVLTISGTSVSPDLEVALIKNGGTIAWTIVGLPVGHTLEIDFHAQGLHKGPFAASPEAVRQRAKARSTVSSFPDRYTVTGGGEVSPVESFASAYKGAWKYAVTVRDASGAVVAAIDPMIVVK